MKLKSSAQLKGKHSLFANHRFVFLWLASAVSSFSLSTYMLSEEWYVVSGLGRPSMLGVVMMLTMIPRVALMFIGGALADHFERRKVLFYSDFIRGILVGGMALLVLGGSLNIWILMVFALLFGTLDAFFWPASRSMIPFIVDQGQLTRANSIIQGTNQFLTIIGPAIAAVLIHWIAYQGVFAVTAFLLLFGSLLNWGIKEEGKKEPKAKKTSILTDLKETIAYIRKESYLKTSMAIGIVLNFFISGPISVGLPILVKNVLHGRAIDLSFIEASLSIGMVAGAVLAGVLNIKKKRAVINITLLIFVSLSFAFLSQIGSVWSGMLFSGLSGLGLAASNIVGASLTQAFVDRGQMGRVQSLMAMTSMGLIPLSFAIVSVLLSTGVPIQWLMLVGSGATTLVSIAILARVRLLWAID